MSGLKVMERRRSDVILRSNPGSRVVVLNEATTNITEDSRPLGRKTQDLKNMNKVCYTVCRAGVVWG